MTFTLRLEDRSERWGCGKCQKPIRITVNCARHRGQRSAFLIHLAGCTEVERGGHGGVRLFVAGGDPLVVVARGAFSGAECEAALEGLPTRGPDHISLYGTEDTRRQVKFSVMKGGAL